MEDGGGGLALVVQLAIAVLMIAATWRVFEKAGRPGWAALIPFYNIYILLGIAGKPAWWLLLLLIPLVNIVVAVLACIALARRFGKDALYGIGLALLGLVFFPLLAWGDARYQG